VCRRRAAAPVVAFARVHFSPVELFSRQARQARQAVCGVCPPHPPSRPLPLDGLGALSLSKRRPLREQFHQPHVSVLGATFNQTKISAPRPVRATIQIGVSSAILRNSTINRAGFNSSAADIFQIPFGEMARGARRQRSITATGFIKVLSGYD
jgi:hypothetical protein